MEDIRKSFHHDLDDVRSELVHLAAFVTESIPRATNILLTGDLEGADYIIQGDDEIDARIMKDGIELELRVIARPGADLASMGRQVRNAVGLAVERLLGQTVRSVTVLVDGVGG